MSPKTNANITDRESESQGPRRGRPAIPPGVVLDAADRLFADANSPETVTMDAIAAAAGVGKGTLFRAFGNREGLLHALWTRKLAALRLDVEARILSSDSRESASERAVAFLDALLRFKLKNAHLIRALELGRGVLQSDHYKWMHSLLRHFIKAARRGASEKDAAFASHVLLAGTHIDLVEEMIAGGLSLEAIRRTQAAHVRAVINSYPHT